MCIYDFKNAGIFSIPKKLRDIEKELIEAHKNRECSGKTRTNSVPTMVASLNEKSIKH